MEDTTVIYGADTIDTIDTIISMVSIVLIEYYDPLESGTT